jgi:hypothetical protein
MNCKAAVAAALLAAIAIPVPLGASSAETIAISSHVDGGMGSELPTAVHEVGIDRPATADHREGEADSLALGGFTASDPMALRSGDAASDNAPAAVGSVAPEPSTLTRLLFILSDMRAQIFGGP